MIISLKRTVRRNILASYFESCYNEPKPSVSRTQRFFPLHLIGYFIILIPLVQALVVELTSKDYESNKEFKRKLFPVRYSPQADTIQTGPLNFRSCYAADSLSTISELECTYHCSRLWLDSYFSLMGFILSELF